MKVVNTKFEDRAFDLVNNAISLLQGLYYENAQTYGALAKLMLDTGTDEFELSLNDRKLIGEEYSVHFVKANPDDDEDKTVLVQLVRHEYNEEEELNVQS